MQVSCTLYSTMLNVVYLYWTHKKVKMFWTAVQFRIVTCLKTWFELTKVKLHRNDLKGNKNYFELAGA